MRVSDRVARDYTFTDEITMGRGSENEIVLETKVASRKHVTIRRVSEDYVLYDLGSRNGTLLNGSRVTTAELADGDIIRIGDLSFQFICPLAGRKKNTVAAKKPVEIRSEPRVDLDQVLSFGPEEDIHTAVGAAAAGPYRVVDEMLGVLVRADSLKRLAHLATEMMVKQLSHATRICVLLKKDPNAALEVFSSRVVEGAAEPIVLLEEMVDTTLGQSRSFLSRSVEDELEAYVYTGFPIFDIRSLIAAPVGCGGVTLGVLYADSGDTDYYFLLEDLQWLRFVGLACGFAARRLAGVGEDEEAFLGRFANDK